jgi:moderate conductance mechanosensitive channel
MYEAFLSEVVFLPALTKTFFIFVVAEIVRMIVVKAINTAVSRSGDDAISKRLSGKKAKTVGSVLKNLSRFAIWGTAGIMVLGTWNIDIRPLVAGAGIIGVAIGFGSQTLVKDVVTGFFNLFENYVNVGDEVEMAGKKGRVISVGLRTTIIKDRKAGLIHVIPNSRIDVITRVKKAKIKDVQEATQIMEEVVKSGTEDGVEKVKN